MKKIISILLLLALFIPFAHAEDATYDLHENIIYSLVKSALAAEEISYELDDEYSAAYFGMMLEKETALGHADMYADAYWDGVSVSASYQYPIPAEKVDEIALLCNYFNMDLYIGKFYVDPFELYVFYEVFLPMDASDLNDYDKASIGEYVYTAANALEIYQDYFLEVISNGESAANAYAMWYADIE